MHTNCVVVATLILFLLAGTTHAGETTVPERNARIFAAKVRKALAKKDPKALSQLVKPKIVLEDQADYGCITKAPVDITPLEFAKCVLAPNENAKRSLRSVIQQCFSERAKYDEFRGAFVTADGYRCFPAGTGNLKIERVAPPSNHLIDQPAAQ